MAVAAFQRELFLYSLSITITIVTNIISLAIGFGFNFSMSTFLFSGVRTHLKDHGFLKLACQKRGRRGLVLCGESANSSTATINAPKPISGRKPIIRFPQTVYLICRNIGARNVPRQELISSTPFRHWRERALVNDCAEDGPYGQKALIREGRGRLTVPASQVAVTPRRRSGASPAVSAYIN
jgi:hypothetical protein